MLQQIKKLQITLRRQPLDSRPAVGRTLAFIDHLAGSRVHGKQYRLLLCDFLQYVEELTQSFGIIDIGRTVQRNQQAICGDCDSLGWTAQRQGPSQGVNHHIADKVYFCIRNTFAAQIVIGIDRGSEQAIRQLIGDDAVEFLRHGAIP